MKTEEATREAKEIVDKDPDNFQIRSCWNCNPAHEHLKESEIPLMCFSCGRIYYKGVEIPDPRD